MQTRRAEYGTVLQLMLESRLMRGVLSRAVTWLLLVSVMLIAGAVHTHGITARGEAGPTIADARAPGPAAPVAPHSCPACTASHNVAASVRSIHDVERPAPSVAVAILVSLPTRQAAERAAVGRSPPPSSLV